jgi:hypothetical protein
MGIQHRKNVTLIRHAYVCTTKQHQGIGGKLLQRKYWSSPETKINASVVLADEKWFEIARKIL